MDNSIFRKVFSSALLATIAFSCPVESKGTDTSTGDSYSSDKRYKQHTNADETSLNSAGFFLDYLLCRANNSDLALAFEKKNAYTPGSRPGDLVAEGDMVHPNITWRPGFRLGFSVAAPKNIYDLKGAWTYYYNKSVTSRQMPDIWLTSALQNQDEGFYPYWTLPLQDQNAGEIAEAYYQNLKGVWQLNYNTIDLNVGRSIQFYQALHVRPYFGLQTAWIHQKLNVLMMRSFFDRTPSTDVVQDQEGVLHNNFWGIGLELGFDGEISLGYGFSILGQLQGSLLTGKTKTRRIQSTDFQGGGEFLRVYNITNSVSQYAPSIATQLGLKWGVSFSENTKYFAVSTGWETNYWWSQFDFTKPSPPLHSGIPFSLQSIYRVQYPFATGGLYLEGVNLRMLLDF